jgi:outer membrane PBP1 activator LpoA protein
MQRMWMVVVLALLLTACRTLAPSQSVPAAQTTPVVTVFKAPT